jgi:chromatin remodeling complex protein RSC6
MDRKHNCPVTFGQPVQLSGVKKGEEIGADMLPPPRIFEVTNRGGRDTDILSTKSPFLNLEESEEPIMRLTPSVSEKKRGRKSKPQASPNLATILGKKPKTRPYDIMALVVLER